MEVKNKGIDPNTWRTDVICPTCKSELSVGYKDISMFKIQKFFGPKLCFAIKCCECRQRIRLREGVPYVIKQAILSEMDSLDMLINFFL